MALPEAPSSIGPYRVDGPLGAGGMGEVYRGWDERLGRPVALKRLLPRLAADDLIRRRFRREAQAAARLQHPAIVQIFDIVETPDGDWIVMELVEGQRLADGLRAGGGDLATALDLLRQVAEGLQEAHARGIVHRDLTARNVLVTAGGRAKILDFGLARPLEDDALTSARELVGTCSSMSPEQAKGQPVGPPSDLFSFGVLGYLLLTGRSPFAAPSWRETLTRIVAWEPAPVAQLRPDLPPEVAALIGRLLRKEPGQRPGAAEVVRLLSTHGAALTPASAPESAGHTPRAGDLFASTWAGPEATAGSGSWTVTGRRRHWLLAGIVALVAVLAALVGIHLLRPGAEPIVVAVPQPRIEVGTDPEAADLVADAVRLALLRAAVDLEGVIALSPGVVDPVAGPSPRPPPAPGWPVDLARATAADEVLDGRLDCGPAGCRLALHRLRADGTVAWAERLELPADDLRLVDTAVGAALRRAYGLRRARAAAPAISPADYAAFLRLRRRYLSGELEAALEELQAQLEALCRSAPGFPDVHLLAAEVAGRRFGVSRDPAALELALEQVERARALAPGDPRPLFQQVDLALEAGDDATAERLLDELDATYPGDPQILTDRAWLANLRGDGERALALLEQAVDRRPSWENLFKLARFESEHARFESARAHLGELLRIFPGHLRSRSLLAQLELMTGDLEHAAELYAGLADESPRLPFFSNLGLCRLLLGRYGPAAESFRRAVELAPANPGVTLNLADAELLLGRRAEAEARYRQVISLAENDPAAGGWQMLTVRAQAQAHLGRRKQAVAAVQEALRLAAGNPQAHHEAALVYALVGEQTSAVVNAEAALAAGLDRRWFDLPWFDDLHRDPELRRLLDGAG